MKQLICVLLVAVIMVLCVPSAYAAPIDTWPGAEKEAVPVESLDGGDYLLDLKYKERPNGYYKITINDPQYNGSKTLLFIRWEIPERNWSHFVTISLERACKRFAEITSERLDLEYNEDNFDISMFEISPFQPIKYPD